ncbi:hypothetical protein A2U01_0117188, partial [Trifolium medium]|nr:hypothetical protein [Trifolium medium]
PPSHNHRLTTTVSHVPGLSSRRRDVAWACGGAINSGKVATPPWSQTSVSLLPASPFVALSDDLCCRN